MYHRQIPEMRTITVSAGARYQGQPCLTCVASLQAHSCSAGLQSLHPPQKPHRLRPSSSQRWLPRGSSRRMITVTRATSSSVELRASTISKTGRPC